MGILVALLKFENMLKPYLSMLFCAPFSSSSYVEPMVKTWLNPTAMLSLSWSEKI